MRLCDKFPAIVLISPHIHSSIHLLMPCLYIFTFSILFSFFVLRCIFFLERTQPSRVSEIFYTILHMLDEIMLICVFLFSFLHSYICAILFHDNRDKIRCMRVDIQTFYTQVSFLGSILKGTDVSREINFSSIIFLFYVLLAFKEHKLYRQIQWNLWMLLYSAIRSHK